MTRLERLETSTGLTSRRERSILKEMVRSPLTLLPLLLLLLSTAAGYVIAQHPIAETIARAQEQLRQSRRALRDRFLPLPEIEAGLALAGSASPDDARLRHATVAGASDRAKLLVVIARSTSDPAGSKPHDVVGFLSRELSSGDFVVRAAAARALGFVADRDRARAVLLTVLERSTLAVREVREPIGESTPDRGLQFAKSSGLVRLYLVLMALSEGLDAPPPEREVARAAKAAQARKDEVYVDEAIVGTNAARALASFPSEEVVAALRRHLGECLRSKVPVSAVGAAEALFDLKDRVGIETVIEAFEDYERRLAKESIFPANELHFCSVLHRAFSLRLNPSRPPPEVAPNDVGTRWRQWFRSAAKELK